MQVKLGIHAKSLRKYFSKLSDREKKLNDFFKLPKHELNHHNIVPDKNEQFQENQYERSYKSEILDFEEKPEREALIREAYSYSKVEKMFANSTEKETLKISQKVIENMRLKRRLEFDDDFKQKEILNEYGNYDKFFDTYSLTKDRTYDLEDDGQDCWDNKFIELEEKINNGSQKSYNKRLQEEREFLLKRELSNTSDEKFDFFNFLRKREIRDDPFRNYDFDYWDKKFQNPNSFENERFPTFSKDKEEFIFDEYKDEQDENRDLEELVNGKPREVIGRVSPWARDEIHRNFQEGWTVKDLSYKFGILPQRVKIIIFQRDLFWKHRFPKLGIIITKRLYQFENIYGSLFKFIDYGFDLHIMPRMDKGIYITSLNKKPMDIKPTKEVEKKISKTLQRLRPKKYDKVPVCFLGKGPGGYLIKDMIVYRGRGKMRVSDMFKRVVYHGNSAPQTIPKNVRNKVKLGPRLASLGYRH